MRKQRENEKVSEHMISGRRRVQIDLSKGGRTEQSHKDSCNINTIMARAMQTGQIPISDRINKGSYGDFSQVGDFHQMQTKIRKAWDDFMQLPSSIRKVFDNDPGKLIDFLKDEKNKDKAIELGLVKKPPQEEPEPSPELSQPKETTPPDQSPAVKDS